MPFTLSTRGALGRVVGSMAAAAAVGLVLGGCTGSPNPSPTPAPMTANSESIFASDEEALAAAIEAYEGYRVVSGEISMEGGANSERIKPFVSTKFAQTVLDEFKALEEAGLKMVGTTSIDTTSLVSWSSDESGAEVSIYLCRDVSGARAINAAGDDVTPATRDDRVPLQAFLVSNDTDGQELVVDGVDQWAGDDFC
jgi:hypothetical protein